MIRIIVEQAFTPDKNYIEASGLSTDTKPTEGIITGSLFLEVDTGDIYARDEDGAAGSEWLKIAALGGGS